MGKSKMLVKSDCLKTSFCCGVCNVYGTFCLPTYQGYTYKANEVGTCNGYYFSCFRHTTTSVETNNKIDPKLVYNTLCISNIYDPCNEKVTFCLVYEMACLFR